MMQMTTRQECKCDERSSNRELGWDLFLFSVFGDFCHCLLSVLLLSLTDSQRDMSRLELFNLLFVFFRETSLSF